ncbi:pyridoxamine 5'-phosphate oxidase family protein [Mycolicibacterium sp. 120266]|uniref:pyridoxamine 5'-phosphate oxidase family protein n=1 Tax=Mycolicibacterium sp. 120266 TaxID=3090601 RepID=UPI00299DC68B|nr:pyridoxamine 5'-phosphate oxidase family protein [Mycolicibacterium sp. 120266]MDX1872533.1 pyridoxamine 5'-phosphate oxidase family protein [Mycolicibacterium sp. 120266]
MDLYHAGEIAVQQRMGQQQVADRVGRMVRAEIPTAAVDFLAAQPMVVISAVDAEGQVWTGLITGPPGFVYAADPRTILIAGVPAPGDPLAAILTRPQRIGMIAIEPQTRRRMRVNGTAVPTPNGLRIHTEQVYSNCPKYITPRPVPAFDRSPAGARWTAEIDARTGDTVGAADTFFVGSADTEGNADASHRGGSPGFLHVVSPTRLRWPDYRGNSMFMTLGNIAVNPHCGLLIPNWQTGSTIQLTGTARIDWDHTEDDAAAQCWIDLTVTAVVELSGSG